MINGTKTQPTTKVFNTPEPAQVGDLLETVKSMRATAGDSLDDEEFSFLMREKHLPACAGFQFLCFHQGCVTLSVPSQDEGSWHPANRWISVEKERIAQAIARNQGLMLSEPPDAALSIIVPDGMAVRHHLQLSNRKESVIVAHPEFLKVRLYASDTKVLLPPGPGLLDALAALYPSNSCRTVGLT